MEIRRKNTISLLGKARSGCLEAFDYTSSFCFLPEMSLMKIDRKELF
jgi:hypothetical protein